MRVQSTVLAPALVNVAYSQCIMALELTHGEYHSPRSEVEPSRDVKLGGLNRTNTSELSSTTSPLSTSPNFSTPNARHLQTLHIDRALSSAFGTGIGSTSRRVGRRQSTMSARYVCNVCHRDYAKVRDFTARRASTFHFSALH